MQRSRIWRAMAGVAALAMVAAACGDDDDEATDDVAEETADGDETASGGDADAYCALSAELDAQEEFPSAEQLAELVAAAPDEIADDVEFVAAALTEAIESGDPASAFGDPEVEERFGPIEEFEASECGLGGDDEEGAAQDESVTELDPDAAQVAVSATEYDFEFTAPTAGPVSFVMANDGEESHLMSIVKFVEGATMEEALASDDPEPLFEEEYESDIAGPGEEAVLTADVTPGDWAMVCYLPTAEGEPHLALGMAVPFTVG